MSTVKANKFSPQSLPIAQIDGFNDVESFVVATSQTTFSSINFDNKTQLRAFRRNANTSEWEEITVVFTTTTDFEIFEGVTDGEEFVVFYVGGYYQNDETTFDQDIEITSSNNAVSNYAFLDEFLDAVDESAFLESYKDYGNGSTQLTQVDLISSANIPTGMYTIVDTGIAGSLININDGGSVKQVYYPFGEQGIYTRDNQSGSLPPTFTEIGGGNSVEPQSVLISSGNTTYEISLNDSYVRLSHIENTAINVIVPTNANTPIPVGSVITLVQVSSGTLTISPHVDVTVNSPDGNLSTRVQFSPITLTKIGTNEWDLSGDLGGI